MHDVFFPRFRLIVVSRACSITHVIMHINIMSSASSAPCRASPKIASNLKLPPRANADVAERAEVRLRLLWPSYRVANLTSPDDGGYDGSLHGVPGDDGAAVRRCCSAAARRLGGGGAPAFERWRGGNLLRRWW